MALEAGEQQHTPTMADLDVTARAIAPPGKGILAADESINTIGKRFEPINVANNQTNRSKYRELLFTTPKLSHYISACILFEETLVEVGADGKTPLVKHLEEQGIIPGIKVDKGLEPLYGGLDGETVTAGLDGLSERCKAFYAAGARFTKWRAAIKMSADGSSPSELSLRLNASILARFATISQACGLVPIVEPEVLMTGKHSIEQAECATQRTLAAVFKALADHRVRLEATLLKPNMVCPGFSAPIKALPAQVAAATLRCMQRGVPPALPGIMFLSGGMSEEEATVALDAINRCDEGPKPWALSFSFGRALQFSCLRAWRGQEEGTKAAQEALFNRAKASGLAQLGKYEGESTIAE